jgi:hypothetical protein
MSDDPVILSQVAFFYRNQLIEMAEKIDLRPSLDHILPELDHSASPDHVQGW